MKLFWSVSRWYISATWPFFFFLQSPAPMPSDEVLVAKRQEFMFVERTATDTQKIRLPIRMQRLKKKKECKDRRTPTLAYSTTNQKPVRRQGCSEV